MSSAHELVGLARNRDRPSRREVVLGLLVSELQGTRLPDESAPTSNS